MVDSERLDRRLVDRIVRKAMSELPTASGPTFELAISGPSCSGKTTLARQVVDHARRLGHKSEVFHFDRFLRPEAEHTRRKPDYVGYFEDAFDYAAMLESVDARSSAADAPDLIVVEGEFLLRHEYQDRWDFCIWIDVDDSLALARGVERDAEFFGSRAAAREIYVTRCLPANRLHRERDAPQSHADMILSATPHGLVQALKEC